MPRTIAKDSSAPDSPAASFTTVTEHELQALAGAGSISRG